MRLTTLSTVNFMALNANFILHISDVPQPPEGPLKPQNVTKSSCTLHWRPPKDDGGSEITHYSVEKLDTENMRWVPVGDAANTSIRYDHKQS
jgi:hypothetical protein